MYLHSKPFLNTRKSIPVVIDVIFKTKPSIYKMMKNPTITNCIYLKWSAKNLAEYSLFQDTCHRNNARFKHGYESLFGKIRKRKFAARTIFWKIIKIMIFLITKLNGGFTKISKPNRNIFEIYDLSKSKFSSLPVYHSGDVFHTMSKKGHKINVSSNH